MSRISTVLLLLVSVFVFPCLFPAPARAAAADIVNPEQLYTYGVMTADIQKLAQAHSDLIQYKSIGKTPYGREIWAVKLGKGDASVLINASHHAREWMTTNLVMAMIDRYAQLYESGGSQDGRSVRSTLDNCSIWFVPMVNPDGVTLQQLGLPAFPSEDHAKLIAMNGGSRDFTHWKSNAQGIDPNRQYPAEWERIRNDSKGPSFKNFKGDYPLQSPEAQAMMEFTKTVDPEMEVAYHSSGSILYWNFHTQPDNLERDRSIVSEVAAMTGYKPVKPESDPSGGGYTDWFIQTLGRPGVTAEIGDYAGEADLPLSEFPRIWEENRSMGLFAAEQGHALLQKRTPVQTVATELTLLEPATLYGQPDHRAELGTSLTPQLLTADARIGNWFRVDTWLGPSWVHVFHPIVGRVEVAPAELSLKGNTALYRAPYESSAPLGELGPQTITAFEHWGEWYHIHTWIGDAWIHAK